jgi:hypothetical protein
MDKTAFKIITLDEAKSDFAYWQTRPFEERLATLESIRNNYIKWVYDIRPGFQGVCRIVKQKGDRSTAGFGRPGKSIIEGKAYITKVRKGENTK